jgi:hypothetical protein
VTSPFSLIGSRSWPRQLNNEVATDNLEQTCDDLTCLLALLRKSTGMQPI